MMITIEDVVDQVAQNTKYANHASIHQIRLWLLGKQPAPEWLKIIVKQMIEPDKGDVEQYVMRFDPVIKATLPPYSAVLSRKLIRAAWNMGAEGITAQYMAFRQGTCPQAIAARLAMLCDLGALVQHGDVYYIPHMRGDHV